MSSGADRPSIGGRSMPNGADRPSIDGRSAVNERPIGPLELLQRKFDFFIQKLINHFHRHLYRPLKHKFSKLADRLLIDVWWSRLAVDRRPIDA